MSKNIKCLACPTRNAQDAKYIVKDLDGVSEHFYPVCEEHFEEICRQEGEINVTYFEVEELTAAKTIEEANKNNAYWQKRYENLLKEYTAARKLLKLPSGPLPSEILAKELQTNANQQYREDKE